MPRIEFDCKEDLVKWMTKRLDPKKHEVYITRKRREVIVHPIKSTPPITFAYYRANSLDELKAIMGYIVNANVNMFRTGHYNWKTDSPVGSLWSEEKDE